MLARGDASALAEYHLALATLDALAVKDPTNAERQVDLAEGHGKVGDALLARRQRTAARAEYQVSLAIARRLRAKDPHNASYRELVTTLGAKAKHGS
jgi:hypothetical protein